MTFRRLVSSGPSVLTRAFVPPTVSPGSVTTATSTALTISTRYTMYLHGMQSRTPNHAPNRQRRRPPPPGFVSPDKPLRQPQFGQSTVVGKSNVVGDIAGHRVHSRAPPFPRPRAAETKDAETEAAASKTTAAEASTSASTSTTDTAATTLAKDAGADAAEATSNSKPGTPDSNSSVAAHTETSGVPTLPSQAASSKTVSEAEVESFTRLYCNTVTLLAGFKGWAAGYLKRDPTRVQYNAHGVPIEGPLFSLPFRDQLRIYLAMLAALAVTKAIFDIIEFELMYYGMWQVGYKKNESHVKRLLYYMSSACVAVGLFAAYNCVLIVFSALVGRGKFGRYMVQSVCANVLPKKILKWRLLRLLTV